MKKYLIALVISLVTLAFVGCDGILTGQFTITYDIDEIGQSEDILHMYSLVLSDDETYAEHQENIESLDEISVVAWLHNYGSGGVTTQVYVDTIYTHETVEDVIENATLIFEPDFEVPGNDSVLVDWENGLDYMVEDATEFLDYLILERGEMAVYAIAQGTPPFDARVDAVIVITFTARN